MRVLLAIVAAFCASSAFAADKIAFVGALSGPAAAIGRDQRDGFLLAVAEQNGRLGGIAVKVLEYDDRGEPRRASAIADQLLAEGVQIVTGLTTSDSAFALHEILQGKPVVLVSSGAAPVALAGPLCSRYFFSTAPVEDAVHENAGAIAQARRYRSAYLVTLPATRGVVEAAFRRRFTGVVGGTDYPAPDAGLGAEIGQILKARPDAVYTALPKEAMRSFLRTYDAAGLFHRIPVIAPHSEPGTLEALGPDFSGLTMSARWAPGVESRASERFVAAFARRYGRVPSVHAMQGFDAALLLGAAFRAAKAAPVAAEAIARALASQRIDAVSGPFRLAANRFPVTDWHAWEVFNDSSGAPYLVAREQTLRGYTDPHAERCAVR